MGTAAAANAELSATVTGTSEYDFRGISQSAEDPALQGSVDWSSEGGFYASAWASNIDFGPGVDADIELDLIVGIAGETGGGIGWDTGIIWYAYPGSSDVDDYPEIYFGLSYAMLSLTQYYSNDLFGTDLDGFYTEGNASFELPAGFALNLHAGYSYGDAFDDTEYLDYSVGLGYTFNKFDLELKYVDTDLDDGDPLFSDDDVFNSEGRVIFLVSTTFPW